MIGSISSAELGILLVYAIGALLIVALPAGRICARLGFSRWLGLLTVVPVVNLGLLWYVAFAPRPGRGDATGQDGIAPPPNS